MLHFIRKYFHFRCVIYFIGLFLVYILTIYTLYTQVRKCNILVGRVCYFSLGFRVGALGSLLWRGESKHLRLLPSSQPKLTSFNGRSIGKNSSHWVCTGTKNKVPGKLREPCMFWLLSKLSENSIFLITALANLSLLENVHGNKHNFHKVISCWFRYNFSEILIANLQWWICAIISYYFLIINFMIKWWIFRDTEKL